MLCLFTDVCDVDGGSLRPWWPGSLMEQPAVEHQALRVIRSAWSDERKATMKEKNPNV